MFAPRVSEIAVLSSNKKVNFVSNITFQFSGELALFVLNLRQQMRISAGHAPY